LNFKRKKGQTKRIRKVAKSVKIRYVIPGHQIPGFKVLFHKCMRIDLNPQYTSSINIQLQSKFNFNIAKNENKFKVYFKKRT
jgi:hypothetical protein